MDLKKDVLPEVKKYVKVEVDLQGLVGDVVVGELLLPQVQKLVDKIKAAIPGGIDDALLDGIMQKEMPVLQAELKQELAKLEEKLKNVI